MEEQKQMNQNNYISIGGKTTQSNYCRWRANTVLSLCIPSGPDPKDEKNYKSIFNGSEGSVSSGWYCHPDTLLAIW